MCRTGIEIHAHTHRGEERIGEADKSIAFRFSEDNEKQFSIISLIEIGFPFVD